MKSDYKSYSVKCLGCGIIRYVTALIMDSKTVMVHCIKCHARVPHKKLA